MQSSWAASYLWGVLECLLSCRDHGGPPPSAPTRSSRHVRNDLSRVPIQGSLLLTMRNVRCALHPQHSIASFHLEEYEAAKEAFDAGAVLAPGDKQFKTWAAKCQAELDGACLGVADMTRAVPAVLAPVDVQFEMWAVRVPGSTEWCVPSRVDVMCASVDAMCPSASIWPSAGGIITEAEIMACSCAPAFLFSLPCAESFRMEKQLTPECSAPSPPHLPACLLSCTQTSKPSPSPLPRRSLRLRQHLHHLYPLRPSSNSSPPPNQQ